MALSAAEKRKRATARQRQRRAAEKKAHAAPRKRAAATSDSAKTAGRTAIARGISAFLEECRSSNGGGAGAVKRKPETIQRAIEKREARILVSPTALAELKERAKLRELRTALERAEPGGSPARQVFIAHAAEWAATNHIPYSVFREMGVKPAVLEEAGITR